MDCSPSGSSIHGDSPGKNTGVGCYSFLKGIFLIQIEPMSPELQAGRFFTIWDTREEMEKIFLWVIKNSIDLYLWFFCRIFIVSGLVFGSLKHFEFIFVYGVRKCSNFILLHILGGDLFTQSCPTLVIPWTVAHQAPLSMRFSRQEYCSGLSFPSPGDLPKQWIDRRRAHREKAPPPARLQVCAWPRPRLLRLPGRCALRRLTHLSIWFSFKELLHFKTFLSNYM